MRKRIRVECTITYRCNAVCFACNKAVNLAKFPNTEMTTDQMRRAVDQAIDQNVHITRFTVSGGEPIVHKELQTIVDEVCRLPGLGQCRVLTNSLNSTKEKRDAIKLPKQANWVEEPLDDSDDPLSGKNKPGARLRNRVHFPFWISPADLGLKSNWEKCPVRGWCGKGLDSSGWSMCGKAGEFGRLHGINPHMREGDIFKHVNTPINDICKHCVYGLGKTGQAKLNKAVTKGEIPYTMSPTYVKLFKEYKDNPIEFDRY